MHDASLVQTQRENLRLNPLRRQYLDLNEVTCIDVPLSCASECIFDQRDGLLHGKRRETFALLVSTAYVQVHEGLNQSVTGTT